MINIAACKLILKISGLMVPRSYLPRCLRAHLTAPIEQTVSPGQRKLDTHLRREWETLASPLGRLDVPLVPSLQRKWEMLSSPLGRLAFQ